MKTLCAPDNVACLAHDIAQAGPVAVVLVLTVLVAATIATLATKGR
jgi:hypothetical protein